MQEIPESLAEFAMRELRGRGLEIHTGTRLDALTADQATLSSGEQIPTRCLCWTAGVKPPPVVAELGLPAERGTAGYVTDRYMRVEGFPGVWAIGDAAAVPDPAKRRKAASPPTAQHALRQGRRVADNVAAVAQGPQAQALPLPHARACSWTWGSTWPWPPCSACACAACPPGSPRGPTT